MRKLSKIERRTGVALLLTTAALGVSGCGHNYSGEGNEFDVLGRVTDPGSKSLKADIYEIREARGEAEDWFDDHDEHQLHDNCQCGDDFLASGETVGHVEGLYGQEIEPEEVAIGACVRLIGRIRADRQGKGAEDRPVYEVARVVEC